MPISIKNNVEIEKMRTSCRLAAEVLEFVKENVVAGITTDELNTLCHEYIVNVQKAIPAPLNYHGFPKSICTSVNHVVCHGIPSDTILKREDIINIDITVIKDGYHGDTSQMFCLSDTSQKAQRLVKTAYECLKEAISIVQPGQRLGTIGHTIQKLAEGKNYSIVREYCGHGIGTVFHEEPQILHYGQPNTGLALSAGMTFTIEPMINLGKRHVKLLSDQWTVVTRDRSLSAQWEHTILVTDNGYEVLTARSDENFD